MNKHCFRLIFSKPLGFLIPVAEIATAKRKPGQQRTPCLPPTPLAFSLKRIVLSLLLAATPGWAAAEILLDRNFGGTSVGSAANGVPVIEISKTQRSRRCQIHLSTRPRGRGQAPTLQPGPLQIRPFLSPLTLR